MLEALLETWVKPESSQPGLPPRKLEARSKQRPAGGMLEARPRPTQGMLEARAGEVSNVGGWWGEVK